MIQSREGVNLNLQLVCKEQSVTFNEKPKSFMINTKSGANSNENTKEHILERDEEDKHEQICSSQ